MDGLFHFHGVCYRRDDAASQELARRFGERYDIEATPVKRGFEAEEYLFSLEDALRFPWMERFDESLQFQSMFFHGTWEEELREGVYLVSHYWDVNNSEGVVDARMVVYDESKLQASFPFATEAQLMELHKKMVWEYLPCYAEEPKDLNTWKPPFSAELEDLLMRMTGCVRCAGWGEVDVQAFLAEEGRPAEVDIEEALGDN